jgi:hypothetical protein
VVTGCAPESAPLAFRDAARCVSALAGQGLHSPWGDTQGYSWSRTSDRRVTDKLLRCAVEHKGDCERFHGCYGGTWGDVGICRFSATCRGSRIVAQADPALYFDCATLGGSCEELSGQACCKTTSCVESKCLSPTQSGTCSQGIYWEINCEPAGALCVSYGASLGVCVGSSGANGETCTDPTEIQCLSPTMVRYCLNKRYHTYDCSKHPFFKRCSQTETCAGTGPTEPTSRCEADTLVLEVFGYRGTVNCKDLGFPSCSEAVQGKGRCKP